jgi:hypothetical protein
MRELHGLINTIPEAMTNLIRKDLITVSPTANWIEIIFDQILV